MFTFDYSEYYEKYQIDNVLTPEMIDVIRFDKMDIIQRYNPKIIDSGEKLQIDNFIIKYDHNGVLTNIIFSDGEVYLIDRRIMFTTEYMNNDTPNHIEYSLPDLKLYAIAWESVDLWNRINDPAIVIFDKNGHSDMLYWYVRGIKSRDYGPHDMTFQNGFWTIKWSNNDHKNHDIIKWIRENKIELDDQCCIKHKKDRLLFKMRWM